MLTVTTWNVENFTTGSPAFGAKLGYVTKTLLALDPDVIALQEVLDPQALEQLAANLNRHAVAATPDGRGNRVALLFRSAPSDMIEISAWRGDPSAIVYELEASGKATVVPRLPRPALQASLVHAGRRIAFINVHLKSKQLRFPSSGEEPRLTPRNESERVNAAHFALQRRMAEAQTVRAHATDALKRGDDVIVLGDFNDGDDSATTQLFYAAPDTGPASDALRLVNVALLAPSEQRWSHFSGGHKELIDHIFVSPGLMRVDGKHRAPAIAIGNADLPMAPNQPRLDFERPDHAPVTATLAV